MIDADAFCVVRQAAGGIETGEKVHVAHIAFALQIPDGRSSTRQKVECDRQRAARPELERIGI